jgi:hypothetical protein
VDYAGGTQQKVTVAVVRLPFQPDIYDTAITYTQPIVDSIRVHFP